MQILRSYHCAGQFLPYGALDLNMESVELVEIDTDK